MMKEKRFYAKRQTKALLMLFLAAPAISACSSQEAELELRDAEIEYGMVLLPEKLIEQPIERSRIRLTDSDGASLPALPEPGSYSVIVEVDKKEIGTASLQVRDTIAPHLVRKTDIISIPTDALLLDSDLIKSQIAAQDLSGITFSLDDSQVAYGVPGSYPAEASFSDRSGNKTVWPFQVEITESPQEMNPEQNSQPVDDNQTASAENEVTSGTAASNPAEGYGTVVNGILIVNKKHPISADYSPGNDPAASEAVHRLIADMKNSGLDVSYETSGFRDYNYQASLYNGYVSRDGVAAADTYSARPGYSEHQTGLTFDLKHSDGSLITRENEAQWLRDHAADYGFIIRYPFGKENITGYTPEPWHLRYVGADHARKIRDNNLTLEEYLGVEGGDYSN